MRDDNFPDSPGSLPASARVDWSDLRLFLHVIDSGSISGAAKSLQLAQPTISQRLKDLELRLNTQLVVRSPNGVVPTEAGARLRTHVTTMQRSAAAIDQLFREFDDRLEGRVRLMTPDGLGAFWLAPRLPAFQRIHPGITVSVDAGIWPDFPLRDEVGVSIQYHERKFGEHVVEPIGFVHFAPFASRNYLDTYGTPTTAQAMLGHRTVQLSSQQLQQENWDPKADAVRKLSMYNIETNCSAFLIMSVLSDGGIAYMPTCSATMMPDLVMLGEQPVASTTLYLVYDPHVRKVARAAKLIDWIKAAFDPQLHPWFRRDFVHPRDFPEREKSIVSFTPVVE